jgi:hypothetical protein
MYKFVRSIAVLNNCDQIFQFVYLCHKIQSFLNRNICYETALVLRNVAVLLKKNEEISLVLDKIQLVKAFVFEY